MAAIIRSVRLTGAESFWYVLGCVWFGAMYLAKVPAKKALSEVGLARMSRAEQFWYVVSCIAFGAGYLLKVPLKKALSEVAYGPGPDESLARAYSSLARPQRASSRQAPRHSRGVGQHSLQRPQLQALPAQRQAHHDSLRDDTW